MELDPQAMSEPNSSGLHVSALANRLAKLGFGPQTLKRRGQRGRPTSYLSAFERAVQLVCRKARSAPDANGSTVPIAAMPTETFPLSVPLKLRMPDVPADVPV
jgi:hypothetical protein